MYLQLLVISHTLSTHIIDLACLTQSDSPVNIPNYLFYLSDYLLIYPDSVISPKLFSDLLIN